MSAYAHPVVMIPGMMCDHRLFDPQVQVLGDSHSIITATIPMSSSIEAMAESLLEALPDCFALLGLSMGGIIAMEMWRQAPEKIERLALLDTNHRADTPERRSLRDRQIEDVKRGELWTVMREELKPNYLASIHQGNTALLDHVLNMGMEQGEDAFVAQSLALRDRPDSQSTLPSITCPTLVLCGDEDRLCTPETHRQIADAIPGADLRVITDCGHLATLEQPEPVNTALREWLQAA